MAGRLNSTDGTIDLNGAAIFAEVAALGSFRLAAARLGVPRSTISRKVAELEGALGVQLLQRSTRSVRVTEAGRVYLARAAPALAQLREAREDVAQHLGAPRGELRIAAPGWLCTTPLAADLLSAFARAYPEVRLVLVAMDAPPRLIEDGFDASLQTGSLREAGLTALRVARGSLNLYASPEYLARRGTPAHPRELGDHDCLLLATACAGNSWGFHERGRALSVVPRARFASSDMQLLRGLAERGLGICRLPELLVAEAVGAGRLVELLPRFAGPNVDLYFVHRAGRAGSPALRVLVQQLRHLLPTLKRVSPRAPRRQP